MRPRNCRLRDQSPSAGDRRFLINIANGKKWLAALPTANLYTAAHSGNRRWGDPGPAVAEGSNRVARAQYAILRAYGLRIFLGLGHPALVVGSPSTSANTATMWAHGAGNDGPSDLRVRMGLMATMPPTRSVI